MEAKFQLDCHMTQNINEKWFRKYQNYIIINISKLDCTIAFNLSTFVYDIRQAVRTRSIFAVTFDLWAQVTTNLGCWIWGLRDQYDIC